MENSPALQAVLERFAGSLLPSFPAIGPAEILQSGQEGAVFAPGFFANGCPVRSRGNAQSMAYIRFENQTAFRTSETMATFAFGPGVPDPRGPVAFWRHWWEKNKSALAQ